MRIERGFIRFSEHIDIHRLERESQRLLFIGLLLGVLFHAGLAVFVRSEKPVARARTPAAPSKPFKTDLIALPPRHQGFYAVTPHLFHLKALKRERGAVSSSPDMRLPEFNRPPGITDHPYSFRREQIETPDVRIDTDLKNFLRAPFDSIVSVARLSSREFSFRDEMLTVEDYILEDDRYANGIVFLNPSNTLTIRGGVAIPMIFGSAYPSPSLSPGIAGLAEAAKNFTDLSVIIPGKRLFLSGGVSIRYPFIYIASGDAWDYRPFEAKAAGEYLKNGGFAVFENLQPWLEQSPGEASLRQFIQDALGSEAHFGIIPNDHPIYHCFFELADGPPLGSEVKTMNGNVMGKPVPYLEGIWVRERMVAVYSNKGYGNIWPLRENSDPQRKMGMNLLVFALLQEGGKADKRFDPSLEPDIPVKRWVSGESASPFGTQGEADHTPRSRPRGRSR